MLTSLSSCNNSISGVQSQDSQIEMERIPGNDKRKPTAQSITMSRLIVSQTKDRFSYHRPENGVATYYSTVLTLLAYFGITLLNLDPVSAHGTLVDPVARNSLWRIDGSAPINYNDIELFCGGIGVVTQMGGKCGVCGDAYNLRTPRPHETGGSMVVNRTVKNYFPRSTLDVIVNLDTNHGGYFEFELCRRQSFDELETEECFEPLNFIDGSRRMPLRADHSDKGLKSVALLMPDDISECRACILRWNYRAGNNWGVCPDGSQGMGCGPQELYRNCADISIGYHQHYQPPIELIFPNDRPPHRSLSLLLAARSIDRWQQTNSSSKETDNYSELGHSNQV